MWARSRAVNVVVYGGVLISLVLCGLVAMGFGRSGDYRTLTTNGRTYTLKVANTDAERRAGLGDLDGISANSGMVFVFPHQDQLCFWMKDTRFPLDMVWVNAQYQVVHIEQNVLPSSYPHNFCAVGQYVIELNAGQTSAAGLRIGQTLTF